MEVNIFRIAIDCTVTTERRPVDELTRNQLLLSYMSPSAEIIYNSHEPFI